MLAFFCSCFTAELYLSLDRSYEAEACVHETSAIFPLSYQVAFMVSCLCANILSFLMKCYWNIMYSRWFSIGRYSISLYCYNGWLNRKVLVLVFFTSGWWKVFDLIKKRWQKVILIFGHLFRFGEVCQELFSTPSYMLMNVCIWKIRIVWLYLINLYTWVYIINIYTILTLKIFVV